MQRIAKISPKFTRVALTTKLFKVIVRPEKNARRHPVTKRQMRPGTKLHKYKLNLFFKNSVGIDDYGKKKQSLSASNCVLINPSTSII